MWLDADDVIEEKEILKLIALKSELNDLNVDIVMLPYCAAFNSEGKSVFTYYRERIIRNNAGFTWKGAVHESIEPAGNIIYRSAAVYHKKSENAELTDRNLRIFEKLLKENGYLTPRDEFYYARELYYHRNYVSALAWIKKFLDENDGWIENKIEACRLMSSCCDMLNDKKAALSALFNSFMYGEPRAETCCGIGSLYFENGDYKTATFWYKTALKCEKKAQSGGFVQDECYDYIPLIQLCVCSYRLGDISSAYNYNEYAARVYPSSEAVKHNRQYFKSIKI